MVKTKDEAMYISEQCTFPLGGGRGVWMGQQNAPLSDGRLLFVYSFVNLILIFS